MTMIESARYTADGCINAVINSQMVFVPNDPGNRDYRAISEWVLAGNTIEPYEPPTPTVETFRSAIQAHVDATAQAKNYDGGNSLASYVASTNTQWAGEAQAFVAWRDAVWSYAYAELDKVMAGDREQPSVDGFVSELPAIAWPEEA